MTWPLLLKSTHEAALKSQRERMWAHLSTATIRICKESETRLVQINQLQKALARKNRQIKKLRTPLAAKEPT